ncbi:MAG: carbamoyl-phosphate synthase large subunit, partial [Nanoarchaeota archaeon]|nr:carbamoyl-phosphate synthase large subunit [Nanoarchaeota archaeon]
KYMDEIRNPTPYRIFRIAEAMRAGVGVEKIHSLSKIDLWFLYKMRHIIELEEKMRRAKKLDRELILLAKKNGFSDLQIAVMRKSTEGEARALRLTFHITPFVKQIDTLAGEFPAKTNYLYMTYHGNAHDVLPGKKSIAVLGSGPYCIGSSVEFDWSSVQTLRSLKTHGHETIMINSNPETVSTDYDESDRLYFEELTFERVLDIHDFEKPKGVVLSMGGQIANNLALPLYENKVRVLGTSPQDIDRAEDRSAFSKLLDGLGVHQPPWVKLTTKSEAIRVSEKLGYPVLVRPSYVLSGAAMSVAFDKESLLKFLERARNVSDKYPVVISKFIENAREIEIDGVASRGKLVIYAITEHVENAGTHSGDATVVIPPQRTYVETIRRAKDITRKVVKALRISGPFNIQFLAKENHLQVIECNVRASRSFPFVSKACGYNFIEIATQALLGKEIKGEYRTLDLDYVVVKSPQFSYHRIKGADPLAHVEMASTGEVACFGDSYAEALLKAMLASGFRLPKKNILVSLGKEENKVKLLPSLRKLHALGFRLFATEHTADFLREEEVSCKKVYKIHTKKRPNVSDLLVKGALDLIINIPARALLRETNDGFIIRRKAVDLNIPLITNRQLAEAFIFALEEVGAKGLLTKNRDEYRKE